VKYEKKIIYLIYHDFAKIYATNFAKIYICHRDPRRQVLAPRATTTAGLVASWATALGSGCLYNTEFSRKCHNNSKKRIKRGEEGKGVRRRW
jgi:hypothetical protein